MTGGRLPFGCHGWPKYRPGLLAPPARRGRVGGVRVRTADVTEDGRRRRRADRDGRRCSARSGRWPRSSSPRPAWRSPCWSWPRRTEQAPFGSYIGLVRRLAVGRRPARLRLQPAADPRAGAGLRPDAVPMVAAPPFDDPAAGVALFGLLALVLSATTCPRLHPRPRGAVADVQPRPGLDGRGPLDPHAGPRRVVVRRRQPGAPRRMPRGAVDVAAVGSRPRLPQAPGWRPPSSASGQRGTWSAVAGPLER